MGHPDAPGATKRIGRNVGLLGELIASDKNFVFRDVYKIKLENNSCGGCV
jgi:hypothetical protein